jgi:isopenicillin-N epimerase
MGEARGCLGRFVGAPSADLAFLTNVTVAINVVINGLAWEPGDEILASDQEYGAINNCLHNATRRWGVTVRRAEIPIPPPCPEDVVRAFEAGFTDRTRLVLCSHITTGTGLIMPIQVLADRAHAHGALIAIDGAHGPGMIPLDLERYGCDFYGGNCHKWLCAPKGVGFLHAAPAVQEQISHLVTGWGYSEEGATADDTGRPLINGQPYMWGIEEWGTISRPGPIATGEAVRFQEWIGRERIAARGRQLAGYLRARMAEHDWAELISPAHPDMTGSLSSYLLSDLGDISLSDALFDRYRITVAASHQGQPHRIRVSTHYYNTFAQVDRLVAALEELHAEATA